MSRNDPRSYEDDGTDLTAQDNSPTAWSLPEPAPEPQTVEEPQRAKSDRRTPSETHTGTDPLGRAIGPAEDHKKVKKVRDSDGKVITPKADDEAARRPYPTPPPEA